MKQQLLYIHGGTSFANQEAFLDWLRNTDRISLPDDERSERWSDTLVGDLGAGYDVFKPAMPNKQNARYVEWKVWFERYIPHLRDGVILVGWSRGAYFLIKYLLENDFPVEIKHLFLVSPIYSLQKISREMREDGTDFEYDTEKLPLLSEKVPGITIFHSKDDFVVPFAHGEALAKALPEAEFMVFTDKNHFLIEEFPELVIKIKAL